MELAIYRITSARDILWDNAAGEWFDVAGKLNSQGRSLDSLMWKILDQVGGPEILEESTRRWVRY